MRHRARILLAVLVCALAWPCASWGHASGLRVKLTGMGVAGDAPSALRLHRDRGFRMWVRYRIVGHGTPVIARVRITLAGGPYSFVIESDPQAVDSGVWIWSVQDRLPRDFPLGSYVARATVTLRRNGGTTTTAARSVPLLVL